MSETNELPHDKEFMQPAKRGPKPKPKLDAIDPAQYANDMASLTATMASMAELMKGMYQAINNPVIIRKEAYSAEMPHQEETLSAPNGVFKTLDSIGF